MDYNDTRLMRLMTRHIDDITRQMNESYVNHWTADDFEDGDEVQPAQ